MPAMAMMMTIMTTMFSITMMAAVMAAEYLKQILKAHVFCTTSIVKDSSSFSQYLRENLNSVLHDYMFICIMIKEGKPSCQAPLLSRMGCHTTLS
ncbi:hypothetical protein SDC9_187463 [bioreactor metagenome]|uniref:Uncharacterized protein n=1 Tax=bioreactor metagenome TaxID=1076179 RepID=A0A645HNW0_9ZZZZ